MSEEYVSPFSERYSSPEMLRLFSAKHRALLFRKLWIALAKAQKKLGLAITDRQIAQMERAADNIDFAKVREYEKAFRHDVSAHIHAFGDLCPEAKPIIHWGATSSYVTDNADLIELKEALALLFQKLGFALRLLSTLAKKHAGDPCLSYTHFQPAQPTTIGKRMCLWLQDFWMDAQELERQLRDLPFLGVKGATGTQASFLQLFQGDHAKVLQLEQEIAAEFGFSRVLPIAGQTYTRKVDIAILNALGSLSASAHKFGTDLRLLAHEEEIQEAFGKAQIGSSAMPYKRNPIYCERLCGLARFALSLSQNPAYTTATQWLERSLDDSANRRLAIPESFLCADAILNLVIHVLSGLQVHADVAQQRLEQQLPHLCMEPILMEAVLKGADRQKAHEALRQIAHAGGAASLTALTNAIASDKTFHLSKEDIERVTHPSGLVGRASEQTVEFIDNFVQPFVNKHVVSNFSMPPIEI